MDRKAIDNLLTSRFAARWLRLLCGAWLGTWAFAASPGSAPDFQPGWDHETQFLFSRPEFTWGRDPFGKKPGFAPNEGNEPDYTLSAVFYDGTQSEAIINDQNVRIGDEIGWRIVEDIGPNYVLLSYGNDSMIELNLPLVRGAVSQIQLQEVQSKK